MPHPADDWITLSEMVEADESPRPSEGREPEATGSSSTAIAMVHLRELARKTEEAALVLEAAGYQTLPAELLKVSERLVEIREAMERLSDHPRYPTGT